MKTYQVTLPDEFAEVADRLLARGGYDSFDTLMVAALAALRDQADAEDGLDPDRVRQEVQKGIDSADRGDLRDGPAVLDRLREKLAAARDRPT